MLSGKKFEPADFEELARRELSWLELLLFVDADSGQAVEVLCADREIKARRLSPDRPASFRLSPFRKL
jgi:hypothetical protein